MKPETEADLYEFLESPLPEGQIRVMHCKLCGAVTYIRFGHDDVGTGDPAAHNRYHAERGERLSNGT